MQKPKPHRILTDDPVGFFEDSWENAKRIANEISMIPNNVADSEVMQTMRVNPKATMQALGESAWDTAKEAGSNIYQYAQDNPRELWGKAVELGVTSALGPVGMARYMAMQPTVANAGEDDLTAAIQNRMRELGKSSLAEVKPGELGGGDNLYAHGGVVEHALRMLRHHYATDGFVDPRLAEDEKKKQEQQQAIDVAKQIKAIDAGGPTIAGSQPATTADMSAAINAGVPRGDNSLFGDKDNAGRPGVVGGILDAAKGAGSSIVDSVKGAGNAIVDTAKSGFNAVANAFTPAPQYVDMPLPPSRSENFKEYNNPVVASTSAAPAPAPAAPAPAAPAQSQFNSPITPDQFANPNVNYGANVGALGTTYSGFGNLSGVHGVNSSVANSSPTFSSYGAVAPAAPAAPAPQATRGVTISEEEVPATPAPAPVTVAPATPATPEQIQNANSMMFGPFAGVNQSFQNAAPTLSMPGFQPYSDVMAPYSNTLGAQGAPPSFGGMPGSVSGYPGMAQQQEQISGLNQMPMSANVVPEATIGSQAYGPTLNQTQAEMLGFDRSSIADKNSAFQAEADRMGSRGFDSNPITGLTDISNYNSPSFTSDPALVGTSPDSVSFGGLTPGGASAAINNAVEAGDTTMFGEDNTANYGPAGGVEVEGNAPEGTGQEGAPEGDGGGAPEGGGTGDGEKRGGRIYRHKYATDGFVENDLLAKKQQDMDPRQYLLFGNTDTSLPPAGLPIGQAVGTKAVVDTAKGVLDASKLTQQAMEGELPSNYFQSDEGIGRALSAAGMGMVGGIGGVPVRAGEAVLGSGPVRQALEIAKQPRELSPLGFYSHGAEMALGLPQAKGTPEQMSALLQKYGVKPEEMFTTGFADESATAALRQKVAAEFEPKIEAARAAMEGLEPGTKEFEKAERQFKNISSTMRSEIDRALVLGEDWAARPSVTREEIAAHFKERMPQIEESVSGTPRPEQIKALRDEYARAEYGEDFSGLASEYKRRIDDLIMDRRSTTKFQQYTLPGGENYREVRLKLPENSAKIDNIYEQMSPFYSIPNGTSSSEFQALKAQLYDAQTSGFTSPHWDDPNVLAHLRMADRTGPNGEKILHVEEIQSDWGQKGKKEGFKNPQVEARQAEIENALNQLRQEKIDSGMALERKFKEDTQEFNAEYKRMMKPAEDALLSSKGSTSDIKAYNAASDQVMGQIGHLLAPHEKARDVAQFAIQKEFSAKMAPLQQEYSALPKVGSTSPAPYVTNTTAWTDLALKRALKEAAEGGYDKLVWTPGAEQAKRYSLINHVDSLTLDRSSRGFLLTGNRDGAPIVDKRLSSPQELEALVGKETAEKLLSNLEAAPNKGGVKTTHLSGTDLELGGEGMKGYYDKIIPNQFRKLVKKLDPNVKVGPTDVMLPPKGGIGHNNPPLEAPGITITPKMREAIMKGLPAHKRGGKVNSNDTFVNHALRVSSKFGSDAAKRSVQQAKRHGGRTVNPS